MGVNAQAAAVGAVDLVEVLIGKFHPVALVQELRHVLDLQIEAGLGDERHEVLRVLKVGLARFLRSGLDGKETLAEILVLRDLQRQQLAWMHRNLPFREPAR